MHWILFVVMIAGSDGGNAISQTVMSSEAACRTAAATLEQAINVATKNFSFRRVAAVCVLQ